MKNSLNAIFASALFAVSLIPVTTTVSHAKAFGTTAINGEGFRKCKAQGDTGYTAIVRGRSSYNTTRNGDFGQFNIRSCFETRSQCAHFVKRVPNIIRGVYDIQYSSCKARG